MVRTLKRGKKWSYAFEIGIINGKRKTCQKSGFSTEKEAYNAGIMAYDKYLHGGIAVNDGKITFNQFLDEWFEKDCKISIREGTSTNYERYIRLHIKPVLGQYKLKDITPAILDDWLKGLINSKKVSPLVCKFIFTLLKKALNYAVYPAEIISSNPAQYIKFPSIKQEKRVKRVIIDKNYLDSIISNINPDTNIRIPILISYYTGMRIGEVMGLTWNDIDLANNQINVDKQAIYAKRDGKHMQCISKPKTANSVRKILIGSILSKELKKWHIEQAKSKLRLGLDYITNLVNDNGEINKISGAKYDFVCTNKYGEFINRKMLYVCCRSLQRKGIVFNFHSLRHTHATLAIENGATIKDVAARLGDTVNTVSNIYSHDTITMQKQTVKIFDNIADADK
ncbi:tyrosine-type recombinase/integrase [Pectinatus frisingensis]|uniref:tyrosine-type recombinase/integrase n=1 Tax=Pectinatus frisingensis TaxID=865 RepID=UPI0018C4D96C|nr:site-specific integrase [Pectinatus frisingensis]